MTVYFQLYYDESLMIDSSTEGSFSDISTASFINGIAVGSSGGAGLDVDHVNIDSAIRYIGQDLVGDILEEPFNDISAWSEDNNGG